MSSSQSSIKYAVASGHHITTKVAKTILDNGGNAFDAAVASFLAMTITEPAMCSMFAGGFANIFVPESGNQVIDFFAQTPISQQGITPNYDEIIIDFGQSQERFFAGPASMSVTGAAAMIHYFADNFCKIDLKELVQPAIELAKSGVALTNFQAVDLQLLKDIFGLRQCGRDIFFDNGVLKKQGEIIKMPAFAEFLYNFARERSDWVYRGEVAQSVVTESSQNGGFLTMRDFANYKLEIRRPFQFGLGNHIVSGPGLPSLGGGLMHVFSQRLWEQDYQLDSPAYFDQIVSAFDLCTPFAKDGQKLFDHIGASQKNKSLDIFAGGTSHFNILDQWGNAVSMSVSLGEGSGYFVPDTDIQMNNMLGETALMPNGLNSWQTNQRLSSMMCPTLVFDEHHRLALLTGTGGATRIPYSISQLLYNRLKLGLPLDQAIHSPRIYKNDQVCYLEKGLAHEHSDLNMDIKVWDDLELLFGGTHTIDVQSREAIGDRRREGSAVMEMR